MERFCSIEEMLRCFDSIRISYGQKAADPLVGSSFLHLFHRISKVFKANLHQLVETKGY